VREYLAAGSGDTLLDLYCGVGLFGLALADDVGRVIGVEADPSASADFRFNAQGLEHVSLIEGKVGSVLDRVEESVDLVVLDPPRAGAGERAIAGITKLEPRRVVYVSCDPATFARDARRLTDDGYVLRIVQPVDLFPQTFHIETVALFERRV